MQKVQADFGMAILLITHDLGVVAQMCDRVAVMYAGQIVEEAPVSEIFKAPKHPYTQGLLNSLPVMGAAGLLGTPEQKPRLIPIEGQPPSIYNMPPGCAFEPRCAQRLPICPEAFPPKTVLSDTHCVKCYLY
jgi:oligopeptide/dipeptide ABC transporter ATP-binding protein